MSDKLKYSMISDHVGALVISNTAKRNAMNAAMWEALPGILAEAQENPALKVLIVRGDGDHFASGADISEFDTLYATPDSAAKISRDINDAMDALAKFPLPTIAQIRGACVGGGCGLALCCDIRFADNTAKFGITPAKLGLVYPYADVQRLIETVGIPNAKDILFSARIFKSRRAEKMGLINKVFKPDDLEAAVLEYAENIAALSTQSAKVTKSMFAAYQAGQRGENEKLERDFMSGFSSVDFQEGYRAFLEKRKPDF